MVVFRAWGRGLGELLFVGSEVLLLQDEKVLEIGYTTLCLLLTVLYCTRDKLLKRDLMVSVLTIIKNKLKNKFKKRTK